MQRKWGWIPDLPDGRDFSFKREFPGRKVPDKVDLRPLCSPVEDQGNLGSCTANAGVGVYETLEAKQGMKPFEDKSRLFLYYNTRSLEGTTGQDSGASIRDTIRAMARWGCAPNRSGHTISAGSIKSLHRNATRRRRNT